MKIISWNVNGLRAVDRKDVLKPFLDSEDPDVLFLQETKSKPEQVEFLEKKHPEYTKFYHSAEKPGYSGVAVWIKKDFLEKNSLQNLTFNTEVLNNPVSNEGRVAQIDFCINNKNYTLLGCYFPNGGKSPEAWKDKLNFYDAFLAHVNELRNTGKNVIFCGDVNCAHKAIDLARPENNEGVIGFHPEERSRLTDWINQDWIDVWREQNPTTVDVYSWWHVITRSRAKNVGWRIDYFFVDKALLSDIQDIQYLTDQMGSDHCPVSLEIQT